MYLYSDVRAGNSTLQDPGASGGVLYQFANYSLMADNSYIKDHFSDLYKCVSRANDNYKRCITRINRHKK